MPPVQYDENFNLHVEQLVYGVLNTRELTVKEVIAIKDALKESQTILLAQHAEECRKKQQARLVFIISVAAGVASIVNICVGLVMKAIGGP